MDLLTCDQFIRLALKPNTTYSFTSRQEANKAADWLRKHSRWAVLWVGPQQFEVW